MGEQSDKAFLKNFGGIMVGLALLAFLIIFLTRSFDFGLSQSKNPSQALLAEARIKPVASAYTSESVAEEATTGGAEQTVASAEVQQVAAFDGSLDGEMIYGSVCASCHANGVAGAPAPGSAEMQQRAEVSMDALMQNVLNGLNVMPARGGRADLSDEQIRAVVDFMLQ